MGNRAIITSANKSGRNKLGIYLHWNGGKDSVQPFLAYAKAKDICGADSDPAYAYARLVQIIGNWMGGTSSLGIVIIDNNNEELSDPGDNGIFHITDDFEIVGRDNWYEQHAYDFGKLMHEINKAQPEAGQINPDTLDRFIQNYKATHEVVETAEN